MSEEEQEFAFIINQLAGQGLIINRSRGCFPVSSFDDGLFTGKTSPSSIAPRPAHNIDPKLAIYSDLAPEKQRHRCWEKVSSGVSVQLFGGSRTNHYD